MGGPASNHRISGSTAYHCFCIPAFLHVIFICTGMPKGSPEQRVRERLGSDLYKKALKEPKLSKRFWTQGSQI